MAPYQYATEATGDNHSVEHTWQAHYLATCRRVSVPGGFGTAEMPSDTYGLMLAPDSTSINTPTTDRKVLYLRAPSLRSAALCYCLWSLTTPLDHDNNRCNDEDR